MNNVAIFKIIFEKNGKRTKKKYLFLDNFTYSNNLEYLEKSKNLFNRYKTLSNTCLLEYDFKEKAYITYNTSKKKVLLYPIKDKIQ